MGRIGHLSKLLPSSDLRYVAFPPLSALLFGWKADNQQLKEYNTIYASAGGNHCVLLAQKKA